MRSRFEAMTAMIVAPLFVVALMHPEHVLVVAALVTLALAAVATSRVLVGRIPAGRTGIGYRAAQHRNVLDTVPAPQHPHTPGRRRSRAPSVPTAVA